MFILQRDVDVFQTSSQAADRNVHAEKAAAGTAPFRVSQCANLDQRSHLRVGAPSTIGRAMTPFHVAPWAFVRDGQE
jgi:hypothetical protein